MLRYWVKDNSWWQGGGEEEKKQSGDVDDPWKGIKETESKTALMNAVDLA